MEPRPGQVRNINQHSLAGLIEEWGAELHDFGVIRDERSALEDAMLEALSWADVLPFQAALGGRLAHHSMPFQRRMRNFTVHLCKSRQTDNLRSGLRQTVLGSPDTLFRAGHLRSVRRPLLRKLSGGRATAQGFTNWRGRFTTTLHKPGAKTMCA